MEPIAEEQRGVRALPQNASSHPGTPAGSANGGGPRLILPAGYMQPADGLYRLRFDEFRFALGIVYRPRSGWWCPLTAHAVYRPPILAEEPAGNRPPGRGREGRQVDYLQWGEEVSVRRRHFGPDLGRCPISTNARSPWKDPASLMHVGQPEAVPELSYEALCGQALGEAAAVAPNGPVDEKSGDKGQPGGQSDKVQAQQLESVSKPYEEILSQGEQSSTESENTRWEKEAPRPPCVPLLGRLPSVQPREGGEAEDEQYHSGDVGQRN